MGAASPGPRCRRRALLPRPPGCASLHIAGVSHHPQAHDVHAAADRFLLQVEALLAGGDVHEDPPLAKVPPPTPLWTPPLPAVPALQVPPMWSHVAASLAPGGTPEGMSPPLGIASLQCGKGEDSAKAASLQTLLVSLMAPAKTP